MPSFYSFKRSLLSNAKARSFLVVWLCHVHWGWQVVVLVAVTGSDSHINRFSWTPWETEFLIRFWFVQRVWWREIYWLNHICVVHIEWLHDSLWLTIATISEVCINIELLLLRFVPICLLIQKSVVGFELRTWSLLSYLIQNITWIQFATLAVHSWASINSLSDWFRICFLKHCYFFLALLMSEQWGQVSLLCSFFWDILVNLIIV